MIRRYWWVMIAMIPVGVIVGNFAAGAITLKMPKLFDSVGVIEVAPPPQGDSSGKMLKPRQFSEHELGRIADAASLGKVVDGLDLPGSWEMDRDSALRKLKESVRCDLDQASNRISVTVRCRLKEDARNIASGILACYWERAMTPSDPAQVRALEELNRQLDEQNARTSESRNAITYSKSTFRGLDLEPKGEKEFEANLKALEDLEKKLEELGKSITPHLPTVTVHQEPEIPQTVASPNIQQNLLVGRGVGLLISPLLAWPVMVLMNRRSREQETSPPPSPESEKTPSPEDEW